MLADPHTIERVDPSLPRIVALLEGGSPVRIKLWGHSMLPWVWPGVAAVITPCRPDEVRVGDVVATGGRHLMVHRLVGWSADGKAITQGDNFDEPDEPAELLGRVEGIILGRLVLPAPRQVARAYNHLCSTLAPRWRRSRPRIQGVARRAVRAYRSAPGVSHLRSSLRPWRVQPAAARHAAALRRFDYRRGLRPPVDAEQDQRYVAIRGERVVGTCASRRDPGSTEAHIQDLWVELTSRGLGIEEELIERCARAAGVDTDVRLSAPTARYLVDVAVRLGFGPTDSRFWTRQSEAPDDVLDR